MTDDIPLKAAVTVAEMARMVGLSRARFYQLQKKGMFPPPSVNPSTKRPFYDQDAQKVCLEVRRKNVGVNGQVALFYARRLGITPTKPTPRKSRASPKQQPQSALVEAVKSLGLAVTPADVEQAVKELFPGGVSGKEEGEVIRAIFLHLKRRRDSGGSVGR
jgi:hypothetical protein